MTTLKWLTKRELAIRNIENKDSFDEVILQAELLDAEGGMALRLGNDLILWREKGQESVMATGAASSKDMEVKKTFSNKMQWGPFFN